MSVYFARVKGYVKIGYSKDPIARTSSIVTGKALRPTDVGTGDRVDLLGWIPGDRNTEKATHRRFQHLHVIGEWFWDVDDYEDLIRADEFGVLPHEQSFNEVLLMIDRPDVTRREAAKARAVQVSAHHAIEQVIPNAFELAAEANDRHQAERRLEREAFRAERLKGVAS